MTMNGTVWGVLHDLQTGEADDDVAECRAEGCTNGLVYASGELELHSKNCRQCGGRGWVYK
jgi:hypothetical protein